MKVLFIVDSFPNTFKPNWSIFFKELAKAVHHSTEGVEVSVIAPSFYSLKEKVPKTCLEYHKSDVEGIDVYEMGTLNLTGRFSIYKRYKIEKVVSFLYEKYLLDHDPPDLIHAHVGLWAGKAALSLSERIQVPFVITEHSSRVFGNRFNNVQRKALQTVYQKAAKVITVSSALGRHIQNEFEVDHVEVIPNVVDTDRFGAQSLKKERDVFTIISVGNLKASKRFDLLIEAFALVHSQYPKTTLEIIGEGHEKQKLQNLIQQYELSTSAKLRGAVLHSELPAYFNRSDLFVLPSDIETFGVVFIEALASGTPVIGTKCGGPEDIINDENGILVSKDNKKALSDAIVSIITNHENYNQTIIAEQAKFRYSPGKIAEMHEKLYQTIINCGDEN